MTVTITRPKSKKAAATKPQSPYKRLHVIIPIEDMLSVNQKVFKRRAIANQAYVL